MTQSCDHKYIHLDTKKHKDDRVFGAPEWNRIDKFYCEKCLNEERKHKYECGWSKPEWY